MTYLAVWLLIIILMGIIWWQYNNIDTLRTRIDEYLDALLASQGKLHREQKNNQELVAEKKEYQEQLAYWSSTHNCFEQHWAIVGLKEVRKQCAYVPDKVNESRNHLGQVDNVFEPMPPQPTKLPAIATDYEPAIILTKKLRVGKFQVVVARPADMAKFPQDVLAIVDVWADGEEWEFDIPESARGTGALSLALDYIVARAKIEEVFVLKGRLITIWSEAHRIRLCHLYAGKYGFRYDSGSKYIVRDLSRKD